MNRLFPLSVAVMITLSGCLTRPDNKSSDAGGKESDMIEFNRSLLVKDRALITDFAKEAKLSLTETSTGLWYFEMKRGAGPEIELGDDVKFDFECALLDGTVCYSGTTSLKVGYADAASGVTEGLQMMNPGSEFMFIIPPYLAYGITGDGNRIPGRSILIYRIRIREVI
ncbi:MAG TPA: FKBP-type peptidyl-prolyl cis-trans isomerase [Bacteroidales bacterium]|nr:FKBP-type peptidyl-prolyl cis-trans isomerase [Bacteroidales bacterium]